MTREALRRRLPGVVAVVQALLVLGPALGPGVAIAYDMPWSPDPLWTPFVLGVDTPAPRAVPSDAVAVAIGSVVGAGLAQAAILMAVLVGLGAGCVALLVDLAPEVGLAPRLACVVLAVWNPYVSERLFVGQWVVLLGLAVLPWAMRSTLRVVRGTGSSYALLLSCVVAGIGGVNAVLVVALGVVPVLLIAVAGGAATRVRVTLAAVVACFVGMASAWALPALASDVAPDASAVDAFAPRADSDLGVLGSVLSGGGFWNSAAHPEPRSQPLVALAAMLLGIVSIWALARHARGNRTIAILVPPALGLGIVLCSAFAVTRTGWEQMLGALPGGGALRDSHKFLAPWVVGIAVGCGLVVRGAARRLPEALGTPAAICVIGVVVGLSPQLVWGLGGRLDAVEVPEGYRSGAQRVSDLPEGEVGLLPWNQYRRYSWNASRVSLTLGPRIFDQRVLFNDSLPLREVDVAGERDRAGEVSSAIAKGVDPVSALQQAGVRYVAAELDSGLPVDSRALRAVGTVVVDESSLLVVDLGEASAAPTTHQGPRSVVLGWAVTIVTAVLVMGAGVARRGRRRLPVGLLRSRS
ncbi:MULTISPECIES: hypothetical protein [unclassified Knoellia]|uniref:hypothetical protein n=1 Tax=Knoellia altitudinis TaxID=3404795 RepID=UPI00360DDD72